MWKIRPWKTRLYQGFPGPFWGWAVSFYGLPLFCSNAFHIYPPPLLDTLSRGGGASKEVLFWKKIKAM